MIIEEEFSRQDKEKLLELLQEKDRREQENKFFSYFPDEGDLGRDHYKKHLQFLEAGSKYKERLFMAGNRCGKTFVAGYETVCHLTGLYPDWWKGKRFKRPIHAWVAGMTNRGVTDIIQIQTLLGPRSHEGTALLPAHLIGRCTNKPNVPDAREVIEVKHVTGGYSRLVFKTYEAGATAFAGTNIDWIWLDEEPPKDVYDECLVRLMTTKGSIVTTFTPDRGFNDTIASFFPEGKIKEGEITDYRHVTMVSLDDVPHIDQEEKDRIKASLDPTLLEAKYYGIPYLGTGKIYRTPEPDIVIQPFEIPRWWPRVFSVDPGWTRTAAVWGAIDPNSNIVYIYDEYTKGHADVATHSAAFIKKSRGHWMPGVMDPYFGGRHQAGDKDGRTFVELFKDFDLDIILSKGGNVEVGITQLSQAFSSGQLKVFSTCREWLQEYRIYRRDGKGKIIEQFDDLMDATRYLYLCGLDYAIAPPDYEEMQDTIRDRHERYHGRSRICGY